MCLLNAVCVFLPPYLYYFFNPEYSYPLSYGNLPPLQDLAQRPLIFCIKPFLIVFLPLLQLPISPLGSQNVSLRCSSFTVFFFFWYLSYYTFHHVLKLFLLQFSCSSVSSQSKGGTQTSGSEDLGSDPYHRSIEQPKASQLNSLGLVSSFGRKQ